MKVIEQKKGIVIDSGKGVVFHFNADKLQVADKELDSPPYNEKGQLTCNEVDFLDEVLPSFIQSRRLREFIISLDKEL
jgi:hypothetical protein